MSMRPTPRLAGSRRTESAASFSALISSSVSVLSSRITSYNVCYTKLLRLSSPSLRSDLHPAGHRPPGQVEGGDVGKGKRFGVGLGPDADDRITSYNVCYTKLLRNIPVIDPLLKNMDDWLGYGKEKDGSRFWDG